VYSINAYAGAYENGLDCDFAAFTEARQASNYCNSIPEGPQNDSCKADMWRKLSYSACSPVIQASARNFVFLEEESKIVREMYATKKISKTQLIEKIQKLNGMIREEMEYMTAASKKYRDAQKAQEAEARSGTVINNAISVLGGYSRSNGAGNIKNNNYLINGQMINCSTNGNLTTCN
jgi:hypothetical protein